MATNFVAPGEVMTLVALGTLVSGTPVKAGDCLVIPLNAATSGDSVEVAVEGIFSVAKLAGVTFASGDKVNWDNDGPGMTSGTTSAAGDVTAGAVAAAVAASAATTCLIKLTPGTGTGS